MNPEKNKHYTIKKRKEKKDLQRENNCKCFLPFELHLCSIVSYLFIVVYINLVAVPNKLSALLSVSLQDLKAAVEP